MHVAVIPKLLCDDIDRKCCSFLWGDQPNNKHYHPISLDHVWRPKSIGGLGLRRARDMNTTLLMKKGICNAWKHVELALIWRMGNGNRISFWKDN
ncbi:hypothetical protein CR513_39729, partial [Mucuna pruriens]